MSNHFHSPEVEPEDPPKKKRPKKSMVRNGIQPAKSAVTKPVVVIIATTWNRACRKLLSTRQRLVGDQLQLFVGLHWNKSQ